MGYENLNANTAGSYNTAFGYRALRTNDGSDNIAIGGYEPLYNNSGTDNIALGTSTLFINRGSYNFGAGNEALNRNSGSDNVAIGRTALYSNSGSDNIAIGRYAMQTARAGNNIALGPYALNATSGGGYNVALLEGALRANTGGGNVAIGQAVMNSNSGSYNFGVGYRSLYSNIGEYNIGFGYESLYGNLGNYNFAVGRGSLYSNNGAYNQSLGYQAMGRNIGSYNLAMGYQSLFSNNGDYNIAIGYQALYNDSSASNTIALGKRAGYNVRYGTNNIFIGDNAGPANSTSLSNTLWIANQSGGTPLIFGNFDGGKLGIGTTDPTAFLDIPGSSSNVASLRLRSSASAPTSPNYGDIYTSSNESTNSIFFYDGAAWKDLAAGGAAGINLWSQASGYIYTSTANDALGNPSAAGANKLAGIYLTNTAPLTFGLANAASMQFRASDSSLTLNTGLYSFKIGSDPLNTFFVSGSSGRVGIGTTNPTAKLSIAGSSAHISNDTGNITITPAANLIIDQGNVGISNTAPTFLLTMEQSGGGYYSAADHSFHNGSSTRWKENFTPISDALTVIGQLNPVRYNWKEDYGGAKSLGFIAEEIGLIVPEVVDWDPANPGYAFGINYANLTALLAEGIKQQQVQIQGLMTSDTALSEQMMLLSVESSMSDTIPSLSEQMYLLSLSAYENSIQIGDINNKVGNIESQLALLNEILGIGVDQSTESTESSESSSSSSFAGIISQITDIIDEFKNFVSTLGLRADEETESLIVESNLNVLKNTTLSDVTITGDVTTGMIKVSSLDNSINVLGASCYSSENGETDDELCTTQTLFLQKTLAGNIDIFNGKILLEPNGDMKVEGTVEAKQFSVDIAEEESATAGKVTVEAGEDKVEVKTKAITETALILVTPERPVAIGSKMNETGDGFIITLKESEAEDLKVNWLLVETNK